VIQQVTKAMQEQQVALTKAAEEKSVAERDLAAAKDQASAILARQKAEAGFWTFKNAADAAGWKTAIEALGGDGEAYARFVLYQKLGPAFQNIMINTAILRSWKSSAISIRPAAPRRIGVRSMGSRLTAIATLCGWAPSWGALRSFRVDRQSHLRAGRKKPATPLQGATCIWQSSLCESWILGRGGEIGISKNFVARAPF